MSQHGQASEPITAADIAEFDEFYRGRMIPLINVVRRLGAGEDDAFDIGQDSMAELLRNMSRVGRSTGERFNWVKRVAVRLFFDRLEVAARERKAINQADWVRPVALDNIASTASEHYVLHLLRRLPPAQQAVVALWVDGYSPAEIAELLGQPARASTVSSNLRHGLNNLRAHLQQPLHVPSRDQEGG